MRYFRTILTTLLFFTSICLALSAQSDDFCGGGTIQEPTTPIGVDVAAGSYVPGELILSFDSPLTFDEKQALKDAVAAQYGGVVAEWSPSEKYVRVKQLKFTTCEILALIGAGKPLVDAVGEGQEVDFNYIANTQGWVSGETIDCVISPENDVVTGDDSYVDYSPLNGCGGPSPVLPPTGQSSVRVAIIDSGVRGALGSGIINNIAHEQTIVPRDCHWERECSPIRPQSEHLTEHVHPHGYYIFKIIGDWFRSQGLEDQLTVHSYQVLDEDLTCTQFQAIKAIELASLEFHANVINLSITFQPARCEDLKKRIALVQEHTTLNRVIRDAEAEGVIVLAAAGNSCGDLSVRPEFPAAEQGLNNLVVVGATACKINSRAMWSNYSAMHVDLLALGTKVKIKNEYCTYSLYGTSFATPIVAAKAAFHITEQQTYDYQDVLCKLRAQADPNEDAIYGTVNNRIRPGSCTNTYPDGKDTWKLQSGSKKLTGNVIVQPNPFYQEFTLKLDGEFIGAEGVITLLDFNGREVFEGKLSTQQQTIDLSGQARGIYLLRVATDRGELVKRIVKQ